VLLGRTHASKTDHVNRTRALPDVSQTIRNSFSRQRAGYECGLQRRAPQRQLGGKYGGVSTPGAVGRPVRIPLARNLDELLSISAAL
jgi:hypothetical protein